MRSNPFSFDPKHCLPDDGSARMRALDALIKSGRGDTVTVPIHLVKDVISATGQIDSELYARPNEIRHLDYLRSAGRIGQYQSTLKAFRARWEKRRKDNKTPKLLHITS